MILSDLCNAVKKILDQIFCLLGTLSSSITKTIICLIICMSDVETVKCSLGI